MKKHVNLAVLFSNIEDNYDLERLTKKQYLEIVANFPESAVIMALNNAVNYKMYSYDKNNNIVCDFGTWYPEANTVIRSKSAKKRGHKMLKLFMAL
jgi:hypothetical protein